MSTNRYSSWPWGSCPQDGALELLGLEHEISVEQRQLQQAFRAQARRLHPDSGGNAEAGKLPTSSVEKCECHLAVLFLLRCV